MPEPGTVDPAAVIAALDAGAAAGDALLVYGVGHFWSFAVMGLHRPSPARHLHAYGFGAVGHGLPTAIGAAVAANRPVVLVEGDGSLLMHVGELSTIAKENLDLLVLVMNDGGFGSEIHKLNFKGADGELARFGRDDFAGIARGFGIEGHTLADPAEVAGLVAAHHERGGPTVIDVPMSKPARSRRPRAARSSPNPTSPPRRHDRMDFAGRRARFDAALDAAGIDLFFAPPSGDLEYLTGFRRRVASFGNYEHAHQWAVGAFFRARAAIRSSWR